jgi:hypothetical protein
MKTHKRLSQRAIEALGHRVIEPLGYSVIESFFNAVGLFLCQRDPLPKATLALTLDGSAL